MAAFSAAPSCLPVQLPAIANEDAAYLKETIMLASAKRWLFAFLLIVSTSTLGA
jgi:hypothetical protein